MRNERFDFLYLPERFHKLHKNCEFLLYQIEDFVLSESYKGLRIQSIQFEKNPELLEDEHILDYLVRIGEIEKHDEIITSHILNGMIADMCQFLQIALFSSLQKRLTVAFALIRKPFVYNLLVILRLYFTSDFLPKFNKESDFDTAGITQADIQELLKISEDALLSKAIKAKDLYNIIFDKNSVDSIVNVSNRALHPSTTRNKINATEIQNINFVFSNPQSIESQWIYFYNKLPLLLLYLNEVLEFIVFTHLKLDSKLYPDRLVERANFYKKNKPS